MSPCWVTGYVVQFLTPVFHLNGFVLVETVAGQTVKPFWQLTQSFLTREFSTISRVLYKRGSQEVKKQVTWTVCVCHLFGALNIAQPGFPLFFAVLNRTSKFSNKMVYTLYFYI